LYDDNGNLATLTYPSGRTVIYAYDLTDRVSSVSTTPSGGSQQAVATSVLHKPMGGVKSFTYGNGLARTVGFDLQYQVQGVQSGTVQNLTYGRDKNGNVTTITDNLVPSNNKTLTYDPLDRLSTATGFTLGLLSWTYDGVGNRLTQQIGSQVSTYTYETGTNRLSAVTGASPQSFSYDANGNVITDGHNYTYDDSNRLFRAQGSQYQYSHDFRGLRLSKALSGPATTFHYDQAGQLIDERAPNGTFTDYIYLDGEPVAKAVGSTLRFIHTDHLATPRLMTNSAGDVVWTIRTRPFGDSPTITGTDTLNLRFPGQYYDSEIGLSQNWY
jgi:YD repeat-containing protein